MAKTVFVPLTDDLLYEYPERILGPVVPFTQQGRSVAVEPAAFSSATSGRDAKTKLQTRDANPASHRKVGHGVRIAAQHLTFEPSLAGD